MPAITSHKPGSFCWNELMTTDQPAAKKFYTKLFGWTSDDVPTGSGTFYTMLRLNTKGVGGLYLRTQREAGIPPHWNCFVAVANVDDAAKKVWALGGKTLMPPFDVSDSGRMTVIEDPTGAKLCLWQSKKHIGAEVVNEPGAPCWHELGTTDGKLAGDFYSHLFGWELKTLPITPPYTVFSNAGTDFGGMFILAGSMQGIPPHWLPYFQVHDCDTTVHQATSMGGSAVVAPMDISVGRFAYLQDPQGAVFAVFTSKQ